MPLASNQLTSRTFLYFPPEKYLQTSAGSQRHDGILRSSSRSRESGFEPIRARAAFCSSALPRRDFWGPSKFADTDERSLRAASGLSVTGNNRQLSLQ